MKKIFLGIGLLSLLTFSSCEDFLDEKVKNQETSETMYETPEKANKALTGVYNSLNFTTSSNMIWVFGDVASDDAVKGGSISDQSDINLIESFDAKSDNGILLTYWTFAYEGINRANNVINGKYGSAVDDETRELIIAQAKFIRAYYYFNLVNIWGEVPLRLEPTTPNNLNLALSSVDLVYTQIEQDLTDAASVLPISYSNDNVGRATRGAAFGLLAKSQLYQKKYDESLKTIVEKIEPLAIYSLETNYGDLFKLGAENSKEVVFAIRHLTGQNPGVGNSLNQWFAPLFENGYYFDAPTQNFVQSFSEKTINGDLDPRLDVSVGRPGQPWFNDSIVFEASWSVTEYLVKKHNQPLDQVAAGIKGDGGLPYIYMRYADIILMKAECLAQLGQISDAATALRIVRNRVQLPVINAVSKEQMLDVIRLERRKEFGFEFHRFFDLMRWGKDIASEALGSNFKWVEPRYYFPIPQNEIDSNGAI